TLIITGDKNYAPYTYLDAKGEPKGMLVDIWREWAKATNSNIKFEFTDWVESIKAVQNGKADIHSGLYTNDFNLYEAKKIHTTSVSLFAKNGYTKKLNKQRVGVIDPYYGEELKKMYPNVKPVIYKNYDLLFKDMNSDKLELFFDSTEAVLYASRTTDLEALAELISFISKIIHSIQQERGASSGYIGSNGKKFESKLNNIEKNTDVAKDELLHSIKLNYKLLKNFTEIFYYDFFKDLFNELYTVREDVKDLRLSSAKTHSTYTKIISLLLLKISELTDKVENKKLMDDLHLYSTILMYKESIGQKRAALNTLFFENSFSKDTFKDFLTSDTQERIYLNNFLHNVDETTKKYYTNTLDLEVLKKVKNYEQLAIKKFNGEIVNVDPEKWSESVTRKINLVQEVELSFFNDILVKIEDIKCENLSSCMTRNPYMILPLSNEFFFPMRPATYDKTLITQINNGFSQIPKNKYYSVFTLDELTWIEKNKNIKVGVEQWNPIVFSNNGNDIDGIAGDYIKKIQNITGINFVIIPGIWEDLLRDFKNKKIDVLPATYYTKDKSVYGFYSSAYFKVKDYIYVKDEIDNIKSLKDLSGKKLAIIKGYGTISKIKEKYPKIKIVLTSSLNESINMLFNQKVDAIYESGIVFEKKIKDEFIPGIKGFPTISFKAPTLHYLSRIDEPLLHSILEKSLNHIDEKEKKQINEHWFIQSLVEKKSDVLNIALSYDKAPFMFSKTSNKGIEADLIREILESEDYKVELHQMSRLNMAKLLDINPAFDAISLPLKVNDNMFYSDDFISYENYVITRKSDNIKLNKLNDLKKVDFVAWKEAYNDLGEEFYKLFNPDNGLSRSKYNDRVSQKDQHKLFFSKKIDAIVVDKTTFEWYKMSMKIDDEYNYHKLFPLSKSYPVTFRSEKVRDDFNKGLKKIKDSGRYEEIVNFYLTQDIRPLLKYSNMIADISGIFIFTDKKKELDNILNEFLQHPDVLHIEIFDIVNNKIFTSL
ncbi:transporter substrate-binding domain-containing protein, partial [Sulfurimonas sp.]|uniref:nitrate- and nitrite sensing domain-containing protein n=1 Tax=Sulfurimonas sp. TaxID=2022749 RepID=UPI0025E28C43